MFVPSGGQPGWVDMNKVGIPQANEQQRLLANLMLTMNRDKKPLPRFWYFPGVAKAVVVATGDDHAIGGTAERFVIYDGNSSPGCSVADWQCLRFSSYVYPEVQLSDAEAKAFQDDGFELALHPENGCRNFTSPTDLAATYTSELQDFRGEFPSLPAPESSRFRCVEHASLGGLCSGRPRGRASRPGAGSKVLIPVASTDPNGARTVWPPPSAAAASFVTPTQDTIAPTVSNLAISPLPDGTARVTWQTDEAADSTVSYGSGSSLDRTAHSGDLVSQHELVIRKLDPTTEYSVQVLSADAAGTGPRHHR